MQIAATSNTTAAPQTASSATSGTNNTLDYNNFLELLVAQLKNQDPTNPSDPTAFVSQLASFSSVEQQVNTNSKLDALLTQSELSQGASIIGRTVTSTDGSVSGNVAAVEITSSGVSAILANGQTLSLGAGVVIS
ncbi:MAG: flagellar hook assembly protein FlgD [Rhodomicrobium sp.]